MKTSVLVLATFVCAGLLLSSCAKQDSKLSEPDSTEKEQAPTQPTASHPQYGTRLKITPAEPAAKQKVSIVLMPRDTSIPPVAPGFDLTEGTSFNTVIVNEDLSYFYQSAATKTTDGGYSVSFIPPVGGTYMVYADYAPKGALQVVNRNTFRVKGDAGTTTEENLDKWKSTTGNFSVEVKPTAGKLISGVLTMISGTITQDGKPIDESRLQDMMGERSHIYLIGRNTKEYIHLNLEFDKDAFMYHVFFQKPDLYKGWLQIKVDGKAHTLPLTFVVNQGSKEEIDKVTEDHSMEHTGEEEPHHH